MTVTIRSQYIMPASSERWCINFPFGAFKALYRSRYIFCVVAWTIGVGKGVNRLSEGAASSG